MVCEKTLESPLDCKKIHPVHATGDQYCHGALLIYYSALLKETPESSFSFLSFKDTERFLLDSVPQSCERINSVVLSHPFGDLNA